MWPQYTFIVLSLVGTGLSWAKLGEPKTGRVGLLDVFIGPAIGWALLYYGGFFAPLGWAP